MRYRVGFFRLGKDEKTGKMLYQFMIIDTHGKEEIRRYINYENGEYRTFNETRKVINAERDRLNAEYRKEQSNE
jgi:hypothetical protein